MKKPGQFLAAVPLWRILSVGTLVLALAVGAGCAKKQLTKSQLDVLDVIAAKIAKAERMDAKECAPEELAAAKAALERARKEAAEDWDRAQAAIKEADKAADALLAKTEPCWQARQPKPAPPPAPAPEILPPAPPPPAPSEPAPPSPVEYETSKFENIHFDFDMFLIREDAKPVLRTVADYLKDHPVAKLLIEGHCDERGTSEYNMALGDRRAHAAMKYLAALGIDGKRLSTVSYGKEKPLDPGHDEEAWAKNRRAVFLLR
jgi:peptidoglycan-associated lipoprotein